VNTKKRTEISNVGWEFTGIDLSSKIFHSLYPEQYIYLSELDKLLIMGISDDEFTKEYY